MALTVIVSVFLAVGLFMLLPYYVSRLVKGYVASKTLLNLIEGLVRVAIFILYLVLISLMMVLNTNVSIALRMVQGLQ